MNRSTAAIPARVRLATLLSAIALLATSGMPGSALVAAEDGSNGTVTVTTEVLGSIVGQLVGDTGEVVVIMPGGANPHTYEPSARDAERMLKADVVVSNGLDLEEGLLSVLEAAQGEGVDWFQAADYIALDGREDLADEDHGHEADHDEDDANHDEDTHEAEADHAHDEADPHIWTDPMLMRDVVLALEPVLTEAGFDVGDNAQALASGLETLDEEIATILEIVPEDERKLVTGHRSLGYFADRYGFEMIGTVIPSLSTSGEPTARELAALIDDIAEHGVEAVFAEVGTPQSVAQAVAGDSGAELVELSTSQLPEDGTYQDLIADIATTIAGALGDEAASS